MGISEQERWSGAPLPSQHQHSASQTFIFLLICEVDVFELVVGWKNSLIVHSFIQCAHLVSSHYQTPIICQELLQVQDKKPAIFSPLWVAVSIYPKSFLECMKKKHYSHPLPVTPAFTPEVEGGPQGGMAQEPTLKANRAGTGATAPAGLPQGPACPSARPSAGPAWTRQLLAPGPALLRVPTTKRRSSQHVGGVAHRFYWWKLSAEPRCAAASSCLAPSPSDLGQRDAPTARSGIGSPRA